MSTEELLDLAAQTRGQLADAGANLARLTAELRGRVDAARDRQR